MWNRMGIQQEVSGFDFSNVSFARFTFFLQFTNKEALLSVDTFWIKNKSTLDQVNAWRLNDDKPLFDPLIT